MRQTLPTRAFTSAGLGWPGVEVARFVGYDEFFLSSQAKHHAVVHLNRRPLNLTHRLDGWLRGARVQRGEVAIIPEGLSWEWGYTGEVASDVLPICLDNDFLREAARGAGFDPDEVEIVPRLGGRDPEIERIGLLFMEEVERDGLHGGALFAESLATEFAVHLIREHSSLGKAGKVEHNGRLSRRALREAVDFIGDNLGGDLRLAGISGAARMSPYHFARLFKRSTGLTPHGYVIERRVRRAREMLIGTTLPIAEISILCGFASQSHMNRHFKCLLGATPGAFRRK